MEAEDDQLTEDENVFAVLRCLDCLGEARYLFAHTTWDSLPSFLYLIRCDDRQDAMGHGLFHLHCHHSSTRLETRPPLEAPNIYYRTFWQPTCSHGLVGSVFTMRVLVSSTVPAPSEPPTPVYSLGAGKRQGSSEPYRIEQFRCAQVCRRFVGGRIRGKVRTRWHGRKSH